MRRVEESQRTHCKSGEDQCNRIWNPDALREHRDAGRDDEKNDEKAFVAHWQPEPTSKAGLAQNGVFSAVRGSGFPAFNARFADDDHLNTFGLREYPREGDSIIPAVVRRDDTERRSPALHRPPPAIGDHINVGRHSNWAAGIGEDTAHCVLALAVEIRGD